jgi:membrane protein implicated in regulation of membrane protease activity/predicted small lipoprotein YifL
MKTRHGLFFGFAVLGLAAIFTLASCGDNGDPSSPPPEKVATPVADPAAGEVASGKEITLTTATAGADIFYTTDGTAPSASSAKYNGSTKPAITAAATLKAIAVKEGMTNSDVLTAAYTVSGPAKAATPVADPAAGEVASGKEITLTTATAGADIFYTTDGTAPSASSAKYSGSAKPVITAAATLKAIAVKEGMTSSDVLTAAYTVDISSTVTWTAVTDSTFGISDFLSVVAHGGGKFVAATSKKMAYSTDGVIWMQVANTTFGSGPDIYSIAYGDGKFVVTGSSGKMAYSIDGETWTAVADSAFNAGYDILGVAYGGDKFVAVGYYGKMAYSTDGETWTAVADSTFGSSDKIYSVAYGGGKFVAGAASGKMAYSTDGETWTAVADSTFGSGYNTDVQNVVYGGGKFVAATTSGSKMAYSTDGETWTAVADSALHIELRGVAYGGDKFVAVGADGGMAYSSNGETWTKSAYNSTPFGTYMINSVAYGGGKFVAVGANGKIAYSNDQEE